MASDPKARQSLCHFQPSTNTYGHSNSKRESQNLTVKEMIPQLAKISLDSKKKPPAVSVDVADQEHPLILIKNDFCAEDGAPDGNLTVKDGNRRLRSDISESEVHSSSSALSSPLREPLFSPTFREENCQTPEGGSWLEKRRKSPESAVQHIVTGEQLKTMYSQLQCWRSYFNDANTADIFINGTCLAHQSSMPPFSSISDARNFSGKKTIRVLVRPYDKTKKMFILKREFDLDLLRSTIPGFPERGQNCDCGGDHKSTVAEGVDLRAIFMAYQRRRPSTSSEGTTTTSNNSSSSNHSLTKIPRGSRSVKTLREKRAGLPIRKHPTSPIHKLAYFRLKSILWI